MAEIKVQKADQVHFNWYFPSESVKKALIRLEQGEILKDRQRRLCVKHLCSMDIYTPDELAVIFKVDQEVILEDMAAITEERNAVIGSVNPSDFLSEYIENQMYAIKKIKTVIESEDLKGREKVAAIDKYSVANMRLLESLQSIGAIPKELGNISVTKEEWIATIDQNTGVPKFEQKLDAGQKQGLLGIEESIITVEADENDLLAGG